MKTAIAKRKIVNNVNTSLLITQIAYSGMAREACVDFLEKMKYVDTNPAG